MALNASIGQAQQFALGELNWKRTKQAMAIQNDYFNRNRDRAVEIARENWRMINAYNDPSAVKQRYLDAGISPQAVMAGAASGAGISGSLESGDAPMGSGSGPRMAMIPETATVLASLRESEARTAKLDAERRNIEQDTISKSNENSLFDIVRDLRKAQADSKEAEAKLANIQSQWAVIEKTTDLDLKQKLIDKVLADIGETVSRKDVNLANKDKINAEIDLMQHQAANLDSSTTANYAAAGASNATARNLDARTKTEDAIRDYEVQLKAYQGEKISADTALARKQALEVDKRIEQIGKQMRLTEEQIKDAKNARARAWAEFGVRTLKDISQEARGWLLPFAK